MCSVERGESPGMQKQSGHPVFRKQVAGYREDPHSLEHEAERSQCCPWLGQRATGLGYGEIPTPSTPKGARKAS